MTKRPEQDPGHLAPARSLADVSPMPGFGPPAGSDEVAKPPTSSPPPETAHWSEPMPHDNGQNSHSDEPSTLMAMIQGALDRGVSLDALDRMMDLYERVKANQAQRAYAVAMNQAQAEIQPVARTTENKATGSWFAKLEAVDAAIRPIYLRHGFSVSRNTVAPLVAGNIRVEVTCTHEAGHSEKFHREAAPDTLGPRGTPNKTLLHGTQSSETFVTRYAICGIFNVVFKDLDDDGNGGAISEDQVQEILALMKEAKAGPKFLKYLRLPSVEESGSPEKSISVIPARDFRKAINALEDLIAKQSVPKER